MPVRSLYKDVLTTGDVARICRVSPVTVNRWIDKGELVGWKMPMSNVRRVNRADLIAFMKSNKINGVDALAGKWKRVVIVTQRDMSTLVSAFEDDGWRVSVTGTAYGAGYWVGRDDPQAVMVHSDLGRHIANEIREGFRPGPTILMAHQHVSIGGWDEKAIIDLTTIKPSMIVIVVSHLAEIPVSYESDSVIR